MMRCCKHCGALLEDEAKVCDFCGAVLETPPAVIPAPQEVPSVIPAPQATTEPVDQPTRKKKLSKKAIFIVSGILLAIIAIIVAVNMLFFNPNVAVDQVESIMHGDFDKLEDILPKEYWQMLAESVNKSTDEYISIIQESMKKRYLAQTTDDSSAYGKLLSQDLEVLDREKVDAADLAGIKQSLEERYKIDPDSVGTAYRLFVKSTTKYSENTIYSAAVLTAIKIDSRWYLIRYSHYNDKYVTSFFGDTLISSGGVLY